MADANIYDVGDDVVMQASFRDAADDPFNPTTVTLRVLRPNGAVATVSNTNPETGIYRGTYLVAESGDHWYAFAGTGNTNAREEEMFHVPEQRVP